MLQVISRLKRTLTPPGSSSGLPWKPSSDVLHIPGAKPGTGWPILGETLDFLKDPAGWKHRAHARYGNVYQANMFLSHGVSFVGPEAAQEVLLDKTRNLSSELGWHVLIGNLFGGGLMLRDFEEHHAHRRIMNVAFRKGPMQGYMENLNAHLTDGIRGWRHVPDLRMYPAIKKLTLSSAAKVFLGLELDTQIEAINRAFVDMLDAAVAVIRYPIPGTRTWRAQRGKAYLHRFFHELVQERRQGAGKDMLTHFCQATSEDGERYSDEDIVTHMVFMLMAAHDTTTAALTNMVFELARNPEWQERVRAQILNQQTLTLDYEQLSELGDVELVMREVLRLYPPVPAIPRRTVKACEIQGTPLPANANIWVQVDLNHRLHGWWKRPHTFDPDRFAPHRAEDKQHRYLWIPFGGGAHRCIGMRFAEQNIKCFMHHLLSTYRLRLPDDYQPSINIFPFPRPTEGLPMVLEPL